MPPPNDNLANAHVLAGPNGTVTGTIQDATVEPGEDDRWGGQSIWYSHTPTANGDVTFSLSGSDFDTVMGVYVGGFANSNLIAENDDGGVDLTSLIELTVTAGTTYLIRVDGLAPGPGNVVLTWSTAGTIAAPPNDNWANATDLGSATSGTTTGTTVAATAEPPGEPYAETGDRSVWWVWTPPDHGIVQLTVNHFSVFLWADILGPPTSLTTLGDFDDSSGSPGSSGVRYLVNKGTRYWIQVVTYASETPSSFTLGWSFDARPTGASLKAGGYFAAGFAPEDFSYVDAIYSELGDAWDLCYTPYEGNWSDVNSIVASGSTVVLCGWLYSVEKGGTDPLGLIYSLDAGGTWKVPNSILLHNGRLTVASEFPTGVPAGNRHSFNAQYTPWSESGVVGNGRFVVRCEILDPLATSLHSGNWQARIISCPDTDPSTWVAANLPILEQTNSRVGALAWMSDRFFAMTITGTFPSWVYTYFVSSDGVNWTQLPTPPWDSSVSSWGLAGVAGNESIWLVSTAVPATSTFALWASTNNGLTWTAKPTPPGPLSNLTTNGTTWVANAKWGYGGTAHNGVPSLYWSTDDGNTWTGVTSNPMDTAGGGGSYGPISGPGIFEIHWDGATWWVAGNNRRWYDSAGHFSPGGTDTTIVRATDVTTWTKVTNEFDQSGRGYCAGVRKLAAPLYVPPNTTGREAIPVHQVELHLPSGRGSPRTRILHRGEGVIQMTSREGISGPPT